MLLFGSGEHPRSCPWPGVNGSKGFDLDPKFSLAHSAKPALPAVTPPALPDCRASVTNPHAPLAGYGYASPAEAERPHTKLVSLLEAGW